MAVTDGTKAIVIGAGIGGLSTAIGLRRLGMEVTVHERAPELTEVGSGLTLWTNAMRAFNQLGVGDAIARRGARVDEIRNWRYDGKPLKTLPIAKVTQKYGQAAYGLHRAELQQGLAAALPEGTIRLGVTCTGYRQDARGVTALFEGGSEDRGDLLVGADGLGSIRYPAGYCGLTGLKPTFGRVSRGGIVPLSWSLDHPGPIVRSVADAAALPHQLRSAREWRRRPRTRPSLPVARPPIRWREMISRT